VAAVPEITVYIDRILVDDPDRPVVLCRAVDDADDEFGPALEDDPTVETHTAVDGAGGGSTHRIRLRDPPLPIYRKYVELGTTPLGGIVTVDGWWARARFPDRGGARGVPNILYGSGRNVQTRATYSGIVERRSAVRTHPEQYEALVAARDAGYFDVPREASTEEIGDRLGISAPSASERLRRGIDRLLENAL